MIGISKPAMSGLKTDARFATEVSLYDRVFGGLVASILLGLFLFITLLSIWYFQSPALPTFDPPDPWTHAELLVPVEDENISVVEFEGSESQAFAESLEMTDVSISKLSQTMLPSLFNGNGDGFGGDGKERGIGFIDRLPGLSGVVAPKWNVIQEASDLEDYQHKLDFFAIEIGAVHKSSGQIWRISQLSTEKVVTESSRGAESSHRYFVNKQKRLQQWDRATIAQAGVDVQDTIAVHFYSDELIVKMQQLIDARYKEQANDLKEVTFKIVGTPGDFHFEIEDIKFNN